VVQVRNAATGSLIRTLATYSNRNVTRDYQLKTLNLGAYRGTTIRLSFVASENGTKATNFVIDALSLTTAK
jgi:hypothetical protein